MYNFCWATSICKWLLLPGGVNVNDGTSIGSLSPREGFLEGATFFGDLGFLVFAMGACLCTFLSLKALFGVWQIMVGRALVGRRCGRPDFGASVSKVAWARIAVRELSIATASPRASRGSSCVTDSATRLQLLLTKSREWANSVCTVVDV
jgi:hypothetical protein